jgi:manganese/zinc/iron transport system substrate-binding protein
LAVLVLLCFVHVGCRERPDVRSDAPYRVVCTTAMVTDIVKQVVGDRAQVEGLMGEGVDPHLYKPTTADVRKVLNADLIFMNGLMLEGRMADTFFKASRMGKLVYPVTEQIDEVFLLEPEEFQGHWDPHVWMDVAAWSSCVDGIVEALSTFDPEYAAQYRENAGAYKAELNALHAYIQRTVGSIPDGRRVIITAHDAFNYFGRAYDVQVMGVQGISTESEAGIEDINRIVDFLVTNEIPAVFVETSVSEKNMQALIEGARARGHEVTLGGALFSDAMGAPGTYEGTYVGMIDHNATTITRALGGEAPGGGMSGRLAGEQ